MKSVIRAAAVAAIATVSSGAYAAEMVTEEHFRLDTMKDLILLCDVDAQDPNATAAIHMCHGFMIGLHHFHEALGRALEGTVFCVEDDARPTRDEAVAMLVTWSRNNPEHDSKEAVDGVLQWASEAYPCPE